MVHLGSLFEPAPPAAPGRRGRRQNSQKCPKSTPPPGAGPGGPGSKIPAQNSSKFYTKPFVFAYEIESGIFQHLIGFHLRSFYYVGNGFLIILSSIFDIFENSQRPPENLRESQNAKVGKMEKSGILKKQ